MPELPEVEILVRYLKPLVEGKRIGKVSVHRPKSVKPISPSGMSRAVEGAKIIGLRRRAKYLLFELQSQFVHSRDRLFSLPHVSFSDLYTHL